MEAFSTSSTSSVTGGSILTVVWPRDCIVSMMNMLLKEKQILVEEDRLEGEEVLVEQWGEAVGADEAAVEVVEEAVVEEEVVEEELESVMEPQDPIT